MQKLYIGPALTKGLDKFLLPYAIDNDSFPTLYNFYSWRGRVKRKRGTLPLGQLQIQVPSTSFGNTDGSGAVSGNLISTMPSPAIGTPVIAPTMITVTIGATVLVDNGQGIFTATSGTGTGTINYITGAFSITGAPAITATLITWSYFPVLPVMGLRSLIPTSSSNTEQSTQYQLLLAFDTKKSYQITQGSGPFFYNVSFYKISQNPVIWNGQNYQQFWSTNYQGAFWATNNVPGFHFVNGTYTSGSGTANITFNFKSSSVNYTTLVNGDKLWFNEWSSGGVTINSLVGTVTNASGSASGNYVVTFTGNQTVSGTGIAQLLTSSITGQDGIRWYDGDPTGGTGIPNPANTVGWVNFAPPLTGSASVQIDDLPADKYYLVGAASIIPFKDRLIFFSPWVQSSTSTPVQLNDVALWSQNGTPYYTGPIPPATGNSLAPINQTAVGNAYYVDQTGLGGWISSGTDQFITTVNNNEDVVLVGFTQKQARFVYTGNDIVPFLFYIINSELGSGAQFSGVTLDRGAVSIGVNGIVLTSQTGAQRVDLNIPDQIFQLAGSVGGSNSNVMQRISSSRDFYHEWLQFTFLPNGTQWVFPTQTLQYNYREESWAVLYENYTSHGYWRSTTGYTWQSLRIPWASATFAWNEGVTTALFQNVVAGTPQGYVVIKGQGTGETPSCLITQLAATSTNFYQVTSPNHCVSQGDYLYFSACVGNTGINNKSLRVTSVVDANNFVVDLAFVAGTYTGAGVFAKLSQPLMQTKQFQPFWQEGRQARLGVQKYLLDRTTSGEVTLNIYLSQDPDNVWNLDPVLPSPDATNDSLIYTQKLPTSPESDNLQTPTATTQYQIWHRVNTSLIGESFQIGITLSDEQMRDLIKATSEITLSAIQIDCYPSSLLA